MSHQNVNLTYPNLLTPPVQLFLDTSITNSAAVQQPETWWDLSSFPHYTALPILIHHQYLLTPSQIFLILLFFNSPVIQTTILFTQPNLFISIPSLIVPGLLSFTEQLVCEGFLITTPSWQKLYLLNIYEYCIYTMPGTRIFHLSFWRFFLNYSVQLTLWADHIYESTVSGAILSAWESNSTIH